MKLFKLVTCMSQIWAWSQGSTSEIFLSDFRFIPNFHFRFSNYSRSDSAIISFPDFRFFFVTDFEPCLVDLWRHDESRPIQQRSRSRFEIVGSHCLSWPITWKSASCDTQTRIVTGQFKQCERTISNPGLATTKDLEKNHLLACMTDLAESEDWHVRMALRKMMRVYRRKHPGKPANRRMAHFKKSFKKRLRNKS